MRLIIAGLTFLALAPACARAAEYRVDTTADGAGNCAVAGQCTLRAAIQASNATAEADNVSVPPGTYELTGQDLIVTMNDRVTISGTDPRTTILKEVSGGDGRVFLLEQRSHVKLTGVTITGSRNASAILLFGTGISLQVENSTFTGNTAPNGAAIDATGGHATVATSALYGNKATSKGGAIYTGGHGSVTVQNSTISDNEAPQGSGAYADGGLSLAFVTLFGNSGPGGQLFVEPALPDTISVENTILGSCAGKPVRSLEYNIEPGTTCGIGVKGDRPNTDPMLGPLADNGGQTLTRKPLPGSPAIDSAKCFLGAVDQRQRPRPIGKTCDIGAVEVDLPPPPVITRLRLDPPTLRAGGPGVSFSARRPVPRGSRIRFRLDRAAVVAFALRRALPGRRAGGRCVAPTRANRRSRPCTRLLDLPNTVRRTLQAGSVSLRFRGFWRGRRLAPGFYRLVAVARGEGGAGKTVSARFRVVRG